MPGIAHLTAMRIVVDRERDKKKNRTDRTRFERFISGLVQDTMKMLEEDKVKRDQKAEWCDTYYMALPELPTSPSNWAGFLYHYDTCAFYLNHWIVQTSLFDLFICLNIIAVGVAVGMSLNGYGDQHATVAIGIEVIETSTFWVFIVEAVLKIVACGTRPWIYLTSSKDGVFNTFDFSLVLLSVIFSPWALGSDVGSLKVLRLTRLLRLVDFIQKVPDLRVMLSGLVAAQQSVGYILIVLLLFVYIFAVMGVVMFGSNDPANFGNVPVAMLTLFQTSTLTNWASIALISFHGCDSYAGNGYKFDDDAERTYQDASRPYKRDMVGGRLLMWDCQNPEALPITTTIYFIIFTVVAAMVIMSLFIGVIAMGMLGAYQETVEKRDREQYQKGLKLVVDDVFDDPHSLLRRAVDEVMVVDHTGLMRRLSKEGRTDASLNLQPALASKRIRSSFTNELTEEMDENDDDDDDDDDNDDGEGVRRLDDKRDACAVSEVAEKEGGNHERGAESYTDKLSTRKGSRKHRQYSVWWWWTLLPKLCRKLESTKYFKVVITTCIVVAGANVGLLTDGVGNQATLRLVDFMVLIVFTAEVIIKVVGYGPYGYIKHRWNQFDLLIVANGLLVDVLFSTSEFKLLVVFRLVRIVRVVRFIKTMPRLRSIVESLMQALGGVVYMFLLLSTFCYIAACSGMLLFQKHDPFYYGTLLTASLTTYQICTLDIWDIVMRINMYGCDGFPSQMGYPLMSDANAEFQCEHDRAFGLLAALYFLVVVVVGGLILPTMLIGIVSVKFETSSHNFDAELENLESTRDHLSALKADPAASKFFTPERVEGLRRIFDFLDVDGEGSLDLNEISPFMRYVVRSVMGYKDVTENEIENIVAIFDDDVSGDINFGEMLTMVRILVRGKEIGPQVWGEAAQANCGASSRDFSNSRGLQMVRLQPYGVLGAGLDLNGLFQAHAGPDPCAHGGGNDDGGEGNGGGGGGGGGGGVCVCDAAGLHHIQPPGGPKNAHGAAGAIYKWLAIDKEEAFAEEVIAAVKKPGDAKFMSYYDDGTPSRGGEHQHQHLNKKQKRKRKHVIHAVGPDLRKPRADGAGGERLCSMDEAIEVLSRAYAHVLVEFLASGQALLRLLPLSGGIFAGIFIQDIPRLTWQALGTAFEKLDRDDQDELVETRQVHLCIFARTEVNAFQEAGFELATATTTRGGVLPDLNDRQNFREPADGLDDGRSEYSRASSSCCSSSSSSSSAAASFGPQTPSSSQYARIKQLGFSSLEHLLGSLEQRRLSGDARSDMPLRDVSWPDLPLARPTEQNRPAAARNRQFVVANGPSPPSRSSGFSLDGGNDSRRNTPSGPGGQPPIHVVRTGTGSTDRDIDEWLGAPDGADDENDDGPLVPEV